MIHAKARVNILTAKAIDSRSGLGIGATPDADSVRVSWTAGGALEPQEGGNIRIVYESDKPPCEFYMIGRVKGTKEGFSGSIDFVTVSPIFRWECLVSGIPRRWRFS